MHKKNLVIADYKIGNYKSLQQSLKRLDYKIEISNSKKKIINSDLLILPGVGSFNKVMENIKKLNLDEFIKERNNMSRPILGICIGMQIMGTIGFEGGKNSGLNLIPGKVISLPNGEFNVGWEKISVNKKRYFLKKYSELSFYFNHKYVFETNDKYIKSYFAKEKNYAAIVQRKQNIGFQFHPEKSQINGIILLEKTIKKLINE